MISPEIRSITPADPEYRHMLTLRDIVLRQPLGMSVYNDDLSMDELDIMLVAVLGSEVIGCTMIKKINDSIGKLRQMAVADHFQGKGIGAALVREAERAAGSAGYKEMELNARQHAVPFYERLGYTVTGDPFTEVGIPHRLMKKQLP